MSNSFFSAVIRVCPLLLITKCRARTAVLTHEPYTHYGFDNIMSNSSFVPFANSSDDSKETADDLKSKLNKATASIKRLQSLYLHGDMAISESDYLIERKKLTDEIENLESELSKAEPSAEVTPSLSAEAKANNFLITQTILDFNPSRAVKVIRVLDKAIAKSFMNTILHHITVTNGKITEIMFKKQITLSFSYE